jgi:hypothetical protein
LSIWKPSSLLNRAHAKLEAIYWQFQRFVFGTALAILVLVLVGHFLLGLPVRYRNDARTLTDSEVMLFIGGPAILAWIIFRRNRPMNSKSRKEKGGAP